MKISRRAAYAAIISLGIVSLLGDIVYEGARGLTPDYLNFLGASATVLGIVTGLGEFIGYGLRLLSGIFADRTRAYWAFTFIGYGLIVAIPLLAFAGSWQIVAIFILSERLGKALRSPARDVILSVASHGVGTGKAFGIHEFLDQLGAVLGPIILFAIMFLTAGNYSIAFAFLTIPFILMLFFLVKAYRSIGNISIDGKHGDKARLESNFSMYIGAVALNTLGLVPVAILLFRVSGIAQPLGQAWLVPLVYAFVQLVDAPSALVSGHAYDKTRGKVLLLPFAISIFPTMLVMLSNNLAVLLLAAAILGLIEGMRESIYRAAVADMTPLVSRGKAYGIFHTVYAVCILFSSIIFGVFLDLGVAIPFVLAYILVTQVFAIMLLSKSFRKIK
ncbi:MAG: MFS transporter [Candidatus Hadarchaeota archaeon]